MLASGYRQQEHNYVLADPGSGIGGTVRTTLATETLQALVARRKEELGRSYREMAAQSKGLVSHGTLQKVAVGEHVGRLTDDVLTGIALACDVPASRVREAAGAAPTYGELRLPKRAERLTPVQRKALNAIIDAFLDAQEPDAR